MDAPHTPTAAETSVDAFSGGLRSLMDALYALVPMDVWLLTRVEGRDWIILDALDQGTGVQPGTVLDWEGSCCIHMVDGHAPPIAPDAREIPVYRDAPVNRQLPVGAYAGFPLHAPDGSLFGTLCGVHPEPMDEQIRAQHAALAALARTAGHLLSLQRENDILDRERQRTALLPSTDPVTGGLNRRGWEMALQSDEARSRRNGQPCAVVLAEITDLDSINREHGIGAGDRLLAVLGERLQALLHPGDHLARTAGNRFAVLLVDTDQDALERRHAEIRAALQEHHAAIETGRALRHPADGLERSLHLAERDILRQRHTTPDTAP